MLDLLRCVAAGADNTEIKSVQQKKKKKKKAKWICQIKRCFLSIRVVFSIHNQNVFPALSDIQYKP